MAFGKKNTGSKDGNKKNPDSCRVTGLFGTKKDNLYVGQARVEDLKNLAEVMKKSKESGMALFLYYNEGAKAKEPVFTLYAAPSQDRKGDIKESSDGDIF